MDWKHKLGLVYSTNPDAMNSVDDFEEVKEQIPNQKQCLCLSFQRRNGKPATIISGYEGSDDSLKELAKRLKVKCGVGGSVRDGEILIQGDLRVKLKELLHSEGFKTKGI